jgi:hypothetical protein
MKMLRHVFLTALILALAPASGRGHESPIDHVQRELRLFAADGRARLAYRLILTERAALMELRSMDTDGNGTISTEERDTFFAAKARAIAKQIVVTIDGQALALEPETPVQCDPQLGQSFLFGAPLPKLASGRHPGKLVDGHSRDYPGGFVWKNLGPAGSEAVHFEPVAPTTPSRPNEHPPWLELEFHAVVP